MVNFTILAGGYSAFITTLLFQTFPESKLTVVSKSTTIENPIWLQLCPTNASILYAVNANENGTYSSHTIDEKGSLKLVANTSSHGRRPTFALFLNETSKEKRAFVLNTDRVGSGQMIMFTDDHVNFNATQYKDRPVSNFTFRHLKAFQSRPTHVLQHKGQLLVSDAGNDLVWRLRKDRTSYSVRSKIYQPRGSGTRRSVVVDKTIYTLAENRSVIMAQDFPDETTLNINLVNVTISTVPPGQNERHCRATELLAPNPNSKFKTRLLYVSNVNINSTAKNPGDSIAIFALKPLRLISHVYTGLNRINGMTFGGPNDRYLIAGGASGGVVVFERVAGGAYLRILARSQAPEVLNRTSFVLVPKMEEEKIKKQSKLRRRGLAPLHQRGFVQ